MRLKEGKSGVLMRDIGLKPIFTFCVFFGLWNCSFQMRDFLLGYLKGIGESRYRVSDLHFVRGESVWLGCRGAF